MADTERLYEFRICTIETDKGIQTYVEYEDEILKASMGIEAFLDLITDDKFTIL